MLRGLISRRIVALAFDGLTDGECALDHCQTASQFFGGVYINCVDSQIVSWRCTGEKRRQSTVRW